MALKLIRFAGIFLLTLLSFTFVKAQNNHYTNGSLDVDVFVSNPCGTGPTNGFIKFTINNATLGPGGSVNIQVFGPPSQATPVTVPVGGTYTFNAPKTLPANTYNILVIDNNSSDIINTFSTGSPPILTALPDITITDAPGNNLTNTSCSSPNGQIGFTLGGGSKILAGGGSFTYTITTTNSVAGFPLTGTYNGTGTLDLKTLLNASNPPIPGLPGGTYTLSLTDNYSVCGATKNWVITDPSPIVYNTTAATPSVCLGQNGTVQLSNSENSAVTYEIYRNGSPTGITLTGTNAPLNFTIPSALLTPVGTYNFTIRASNGFCTPAFMNLTAAILVNPLPVPTITGLSPVCVGTTGVSYFTESGKSSYAWTITGGTITSGAGTNTVVVTWNTPGGQSISVNYQDVNGCSATTPTSLPVTVNPLPVPTITGSASVCIGSTGVTYTTEPGKSGYLWTIAGGTITAGSTTNVITVSWTTAGPQSVSVNYSDANSCTAASATVKPITVNALPVPTIGGSATACLNSNSVYTTEVGNSSYVWTVSAGGTITGGAGTSSVTVNWTTTGVKSIGVTYVDANGCSPAAATSKSVTVNPLPTPTITGPSAVCSGTAGSSYSTEVANSGYVWTVSAGGTITAGAGTSAITVTWNTAGPQTVSVNYTDVNGCTAGTATVANVTVNPLPVPTITGAALTCVGSAGVSYTTEAGKSGYAWSVTGGVIATGTGTNTITVNWSTAGPQTVSVNYSDLNGCTAPSATSFPVTVNTLPVPTITGNATACLNSTANTYLTESGNSSYLWTVTGGTITAGAGTNSITVTWSATGTQNVSVNYTNINGCAAAAPTIQPVTVNPLPVPTIGGSTSVCVGSTGVTYTTEAGESAYAWTITGGTITAGLGTNTITVDWTLAGPETLTVNYNDLNGCSAVSPTSKTITVNALPVPVITGSSLVCVNSTGNTYSTASGNAGYTWTISAGGTIVTGAGTNIITVTWNTTGPQTVSVNYADINGCSAASATSKPVTVNALPVPTITGPATACVGSAGNSYSTETGNSAYVWNIVGGIITAGAGTNTVTVTWSGAGAQNISVSYTDINGCTAGTPTVQPVTVIAQPVPTITGTNSVCNGANGVTYSTETGKSGYTWTVTGGTITAGAGTSSITVDWTAAGPQNVSVNYTDVSGCSASAPTSLAVTVNNLPVPTITGNATACLNSTANTYVTEVGNAAYMWTVSAGGVITSGAGTNTVTVTWNGTGAQTISVTYVDGNGCSPSAPTSQPVTVNSLPAATVSGPASVCAGATGSTYVTETGESGYLWTVTGGGIITGGAGTNTITVDWPTAGPGNVSVTYSDINGCSPSAPGAMAVTISTTPDATINPAGPFCSNAAAVTLTAVNPGGTWAGSGITNAATGAFDPSLAGPSPVAITYTITLGSCSDSKSINITVNPAPNAAITPDGPFCITDPAKNLTAATPGGTWSGTGITNAAAGTFDPAVAGAGPSTITYSVTVAGCTDTQNTVITVSNPPDATITPVGPFCSNDAAVTLVAATPGGTWSGSPGITDPVNGIFDPSLATAGSNTITYFVKVGNCTDSKSIIIIVNTAPNATITPAGPFCISDPSVTLSAVTPGGTWSGLGITNAVVGTFDPATAGVGPTLITYSVTSGTCTDTKKISITVANPPDATITPAGPFCSNAAAVTLSAATPGGTWSGNGITDTVNGVFDPAVAITFAGPYTITYTITIGGCSDTKNTTITVNPAPDATITPAGPFCTSDAAVNLTVATPGGTFGGTGITDTALGTFNPSIATSGTWTITYSVTTGSCTDSQSISIVVSNPPNATITPVPNLCVTDTPVTLTAVTAGGTWSGSVITPAGVFDPAASGLGSFLITYSVSIGGCTDTKNTTVTVDCGGGTACALVNGPVTETLPSCSGASDGVITITMAAGVAPFVVTLTSVILNVDQAQAGAGPAFTFGSLAPADDYQYTMTDFAGNTCTLPWSLKRQVGIAATASNFSDAKCFDGKGSATITVTSGGVSPYEYSVDTGLTWTSFTSPTTINDLTPMAGQQSILVRDGPGDQCPAQVLVTVNGPGAALDTLYTAKTISLPDLKTGTLLVGVLESGNPDYEVRLELTTPLFPGQEFAQDFTKVPFNTEKLKYEYTYTNLYAGLYTLSLRDSSGCEKDYAVTIGVDTHIFIPNIFTPNADGTNDKFYIRNLPANTSVIISNRWGKEVFQSKDYQNNWTAEGIAEGIYFYRILAEGEVFTGWLEILRGQ